MKHVKGILITVALYTGIGGFVAAILNLPTYWGALAGLALLGVNLLDSMRKKCRCPHGKRYRQGVADHSVCDKCNEERTERLRANAVIEQKRLKDALAEQERARLARRDALERARANVKKLEYLVSVSPIQFERIVLEMFKAMGWVVESTAASGDHGIDGIIRRDGHTAIVQCKRYAVGRTVGEPEIRDLTGAVTKSSAERGILVTTASFTKRAEAWASTEKIELIDGDKLAGMLQCAFPDELPFPASIPIEGFGFDSLPKVCPVDGGRIGAIQGIRGVFLACKNHPRCHWTQNLSLDEAAELPYRPRPSRRVRELLKAGGRLRRSNG